MTYVGFLTFIGEMNYVTSILVAWTGSILGMSIDYWIGYKLGFPFFQKHGHRFFMGPKKFEKAAKWFDRYGVKVVMIGYFIPGVRHFTAYFSGISRISFKRFVFFAYTGAFIWAVCFVSLGNYLGYQWKNLHLLAAKLWLPALIVFVLLIIGGFIYWQMRRRKLKLKKSMKASAE